LPGGVTAELLRERASWEELRGNVVSVKLAWQLTENSQPKRLLMFWYR
jgi:hypothetical protein